MEPLNHGSEDTGHDFASFSRDQSLSNADENGNDNGCPNPFGALPDTTGYDI